jgi:hypothetical protein
MYYVWCISCLIFHFFQSTCAVTGEGIVDGLEWLAQTLKRTKKY